MSCIMMFVSAARIYFLANLELGAGQQLFIVDSSPMLLKSFHMVFGSELRTVVVKPDQVNKIPSQKSLLHIIQVGYKARFLPILVLHMAMT